MKQFEFTTASECNKFIASNRVNITEVNGIQCGSIYPMFDTRSTKYAMMYDVNEQRSTLIFPPFIIKTNE